MDRYQNVPLRAMTLMIAVAIVACASVAMAAADWQWTKGKGWSEGTGIPRETPTEQLRYAYKLEKSGEYYDAAKQYFLLVRVYPDSNEAGIALQRLAKCLFEMENYVESFKAIEQVISSYPRSGRVTDLVAIEFKIGRRLQRGAKTSILEGGDDGESSKQAAIDVFSAVYKQDPYGPYADDALLALGDTYVELGDVEKSREYYERLMSEFNKSELVDRARLGMARCDVIEGKGNSGEVKNLIREIRARQAEEKGGPVADGENQIDNIENSVNKLEEMEAERMWDAAEFYERRGTQKSVKAAIFSYEEIIRRYPNTTYAGYARERVQNLEIPQEGRIERFGKLNLNLNPFRNKDEKPKFITPQKGPEAVDTEKVLVPVPGVREQPGQSVAGVLPMSPEPVAEASPAAKKSKSSVPSLVYEEIAVGSEAGVMPPTPPKVPVKRPTAPAREDPNVVFDLNEGAAAIPPSQYLKRKAAMGKSSGYSAGAEEYRRPASSDVTRGTSIEAVKKPVAPIVDDLPPPPPAPKEESTEKVSGASIEPMGRTRATTRDTDKSKNIDRGNSLAGVRPYSRMRKEKTASETSEAGVAPKSPKKVIKPAKPLSPPVETSTGKPKAEKPASGNGWTFSEDFE